MEEVSVTLEIMLVDEDSVFGENWDTVIDIYHFSKLSEKRVQISFQYTDEVTTFDAETNTTSSGHSSYSDAYIKVEENLQTLLDIIAYQKGGTGIRIVPHSRTMSSRSMTSHRSRNIHSVDLKDVDQITDRYLRTIADDNQQLIDSLRLNRLAANEENEAEKIGQLWAIVERMYVDKPEKVLDSKAKRIEIRDLVNQASLITPEEKARLLNTVNNTYKTSLPSLIAEKFGLISGNGEEMSVKEIKETLDYWIGTRSIQSHGTVLARNQNVRLLASEMDHIIDTSIGGLIRPAKYIYVVFKEDKVEPGFLSSKDVTKKVHSSSGYTSVPLHKYPVFDDIYKRFQYSVQDNDFPIIVVEYKSIIQITNQSQTIIELGEIANEDLRSLVEKLQNKLN